MEPQKKTILVAVSDVFFYAKLRDALLPQGFALERVRSQQEITEKLAGIRPDGMVINMNDERLNAFEALAQVNAAVEPNRVPVLAFANHEEVETFRKAKEMGVARIVSRNEFSSRTRDLVNEILSSQDAAPKPSDRSFKGS